MRHFFCASIVKMSRHKVQYDSYFDPKDAQTWTSFEVPPEAEDEILAMKSHVEDLEIQNKHLNDKIANILKITPQSTDPDIKSLEDTIEKLEDEKAALKTEHDTLLIENEALRTEKASLQSDQASLQSDQASLQSDQEALRVQKATLQSDQASLQSDQASLQAYQEALQVEKASLQSDQEALRVEKASLQSDQASLQAYQEALQSDQVSLQSDREALRVQNATLQAYQEALQVEKATLQAEQEALQVEKATLQAEQEALRVENASLQSYQARLQAENASLQSEKASLQVEKGVLRAENVFLQVEKATLQAEQEALQVEKATLQAEQEALQVEKATLQAEQEALRVENASLQSYQARLQAEKTSLKSDQEALRVQKTSLQSDQASLQDLNDKEMEDLRHQNDTLKNQLQQYTLDRSGDQGNEDAMLNQINDYEASKVTLSEQDMANIIQMSKYLTAALMKKIKRLNKENKSLKLDISEKHKLIMDENSRLRDQLAHSVGQHDATLNQSGSERDIEEIGTLMTDLDACRANINSISSASELEIQEKSKQIEVLNDELETCRIQSNEAKMLMVHLQATMRRDMGVENSEELLVESSQFINQMKSVIDEYVDARARLSEELEQARGLQRDCELQRQAVSLQSAKIANDLKAIVDENNSRINALQGSLTECAEINKVLNDQSAESTKEQCGEYVKVLQIELQKCGEQTRIMRQALQQRALQVRRLQASVNDLRGRYKVNARRAFKT
jgi:chromosome segregation ATPase